MDVVNLITDDLIFVTTVWNGVSVMEDSVELVMDCWFTVIMPEEYSHIES